MTFARACAASLIAGFVAGALFGGQDVWGAYMLICAVLLVVFGIADARAWRRSR